MRKPIEFRGLHNSWHRSKVPADRCYACQNVSVERGILESGPRYLMFGARSGWSASDVCYGFGYGSYASDEQQKLNMTGVPTSGTVVLTFNGIAGGSLGQDTGTIAYNATADTVQTALEALAGIAIGDVTVTGGPWPTNAMYVRFRGQYAHTDMAPLVLKTNSLGGGTSPTVAISEYVKGGTSSVYLVAIKKSGDSTATMYSVDASTGVYTTVATGLTASTWEFQQYGPLIQATNETDGMHSFRIGGAWDDAASGSKPKAPSHLGSWIKTNNAAYLNFTAATGTNPLNPSCTASNVTETFVQNVDSFSLTNSGAAITAPTRIEVVITFAAAQDWQFNDIWKIMATAGTTSDAVLRNGSLEFQLVNNDGGPVTFTPTATWDPEHSQSSTQLLRFAHFTNQVRTQRDNIIKLNINFSVESWGAGKNISFSVFKGMSWMLDTLPITLTGEVDYPTSFEFGRMRYAFGYYSATTGLESDLSIVWDQLGTRVGAWDGVNITLTLPGSPELTTNDRIYVYRQDRTTREWRRLPVDANNLTTYGAANVTSGTTTFVDKWMEAELKDFPTVGGKPFTQTPSDNSGPVMTDWKQSLVVGFDRKLWLSFVGIPDAFAPDPDDRSATSSFAQDNKDNPDRGRTVYMADNRAEPVNNVHGQDTLYAVGPLSCYAMVGDTPATASPPRRLPGSRGSVSQRASCRYGGGIEVGSQDGLWYYSVGRGFSGEDNGALVEREETAEVRRSWITTFLGSSHTNVVVVEYNDQIWAFNGTKFIERTRDLQWVEGTFADTVYAAIGVRGSGLRFTDSYGRIHTISSDYTDDNGTSANWSYTTGVLDGPATQITDIELQVKGKPRVVVKVFRRDGNKSDSDIGQYEEHTFDTQESQIPYRRPLPIPVGMRYEMTFSGVCGTDEVHSCVVEYAGQPKMVRG